MHTVEKNNVIEKASSNIELSEEGLSYTSILNSAIDSTKRKKTRNRINRFIYSVGEYNFLFEQELKVENLANTSVSKVPHAPKWCLGIANVRGNIIPIVDMHILLKQELKYSSKENSKKLLLMIEHKNHAPIIFQIDKLPEIIDINNYTTGIAKDLPSWIKCTWKNSSNKLYEVNHDELLNLIRSINI